MAITARWRLVALACLLALGLAWFAPAVANGARLNAGMVLLTQALMNQAEESSLGRVVQAEYWLREVLRRAPRNTAAWRGLGLALAAQGREVEAAEAWQNVPGMVSELTLWGEQAFVLKHYDQALEWVQRAASVDETLAKPWYYKGRAYQELDDWDKALQAYSHALEQSDWSGIRRSSLYYRVGAAYYRLGGDQSLERAWQALEEARQASDFQDLWEWSDCYFLRGMILWSQERPAEEYAAEYEIAIRIQPDHALAHAQLGMAYYVRDGDLPSAEAQLRQAIALNPQIGQTYMMLGEVYTREGMLAQAAEVYEQALEASDVQAEAQQRLEALRSMPDWPGTDERETSQ